jgi:hypothetical protein
MTIHSCPELRQEDLTEGCTLKDQPLDTGFLWKEADLGLGSFLSEAIPKDGWQLRIIFWQHFQQLGEKCPHF